MKPKRPMLIEIKENRLLQNPSLLIVGSFLLLILLGAFLLTLPIFNRAGVFTPFLNALFTATSATCVTGLIVYDTYTYFNTAGQAVILTLIQLGGLGLVTLTSFFYLLIGKRVGLRTAHLTQESVGSDQRLNTGKLTKFLVFFTAVMELLGGLLLSIYFVPRFGRYGIFMSAFFAISSYCNAGFDLLGMNGAFGSLISVNDQPLVLLTLSALIICGGLGFVVWQDLWNYRKRRQLFLHTKIVLASTGILLAGGALLFLLLEWNNPKTIGSMPFWQKLLNAFFQSVTTRTAGFDALNNPGMTGASKLVSTVLMFIGAAPGSTGGGVKITSAVVLITTVFSVMKGEEDTIIRKRRIDKSVVYKALAVTALGVLLVILTAGILLASSPAVSSVDALFEAVSAFGTAGLTAGVTGTASSFSRIMLIFAMFCGRVGPVSFALSISAASGSKSSRQVLPEGTIWVG